MKVRRPGQDAVKPWWLRGLYLVLLILPVAALAVLALRSAGKPDAPFRRRARTLSLVDNSFAQAGLVTSVDWPHAQVSLKASACKLFVDVLLLQLRPA